MIRCLNCMEVYDEQYEVCPYCGYVRGTPPKVASHLAPGTVIAQRYIIGTMVNYGGFGIVYRAWDEELGIMVAVKEHYPSGLVNRVPGTREVVIMEGERRQQYFASLSRFLDEARTMAKFSSLPNAVKVYQFLEENNTAYMVMEYLSGMGLDEYLRQFENGRLNIDEAVSIITDVGKTLSAMHKEKIIHRDISPDNIFLCADGKVKLLDFGAARLSSGEKTQTLSVVLKPSYAAPEQYRKRSRQGPRTDIYVLGATLYKMVTGQLPTEALDRQVEDTLKKPSEINPEIPQWMDTVILTAMALNQEVRFPSVEKFTEALNREKTVKLPQKRIKIRRITRTASIICIAVIVGIVGYKYFGMYNDISGEGIPDGEITMMVPVSSEQDKNRFNEFKERFEKKFSGKVINMEFIDQSEYEDTLNKAVKSEDSPEIFAGKYLSKENQAIKYDVKHILKDMKLSSLYLYSDYKENIETDNVMPVGFDIYVLYENTYLSRSDKVASFVEEGGVDVLTEPGESPIFDKNQTASRTDCFEGVNITAKARETFLNEKSPYYIGLVSEKNLIQQKLSGYSDVTSIQEDGKNHGMFLCGLSVNANAEKKEKQISSLAIRYALSEEGQDVLCVQNPGMLPLNKKTFSTFIDINESLAFIKPEKTVIEG